ncbi:S-adenosyl-L-methionine-dependent methyltransferase [Lindgomyces ingoldianus]|uniref:S-adenosyl-L-methionine-dependent methyltransferase n=1 Tax=Lindgomyces ingoldianus TaxID=673940 RepID=A0ACB6RGG2_9PLEO|nr:S-adenosyl-L-methionine-dependent methyltransferase [Lindgomyces ingoldianus]KAF2478413.1 S-adenosyl-L-methionine-dependent methyltransferase [Lindgomyces ingoldianus]
MLNAKFYSSLGSKYEDAFAHDAGLISFIQTVLSDMPPQALVLDVGCGTGKPVASSLAAAGHRILGIDISPAMVELSRKAVPSGTFDVADMRNYVPPEGIRLDAIFNILSLFLLDREGIESMAEKWSSWLPAGGLLCICTMAAEDCSPDEKGNGYDADGLCARDIGIRFMGAQTFITLFTRKGWAALLEKQGFEIVKTMTEMHAPPEEADSDPEPHLFIVAKKKV